MLPTGVVPVALGLQGRIWTIRPEPAASNGLVTALSAAAIRGRSVDFTCICVDALGEYVAIGDARGTVYILNLRQNRYSRLARIGHPATVALFAGRPLHLYVAFEDSTIRCYDVVRHQALGVLREHRSPVRHLAVRSHEHRDELLATSADAFILWDTQKQHRKRAMGTGQSGALHAHFSPDGKSIVTAFQDGNIFVWDIQSFQLQYSFRPPDIPPKVVPPLSHPLPATGPYCASAISRDGELLALGGLWLPLVLVFHLPTGRLRHALRLAGRQKGAPGVEAGRDATAAVAVVTGVSQLAFTAGDGGVALLAALCSDGSVQCFDAMSGVVSFEALYRVANRRDGALAMDNQAAMMAVIANGRVLLYDTAVLQSTAGPLRRFLTVVPPADVPAIAAEVLTINQLVVVDVPDALGQEGEAAPAGRAATKVASTAQGQPAGLHRDKLESLLTAYGEYPIKHRLLAWDFLLQLPHSSAAFEQLQSLGPHPAYAQLAKRLPKDSKVLAGRLVATLSQLIHWCPSLAQAGFLPALVFPFVKLYASAGSGGSVPRARPGAAGGAEALFELLAMLLVNWARGWFECFPHPPINILARLEAMLAFHDEELVSHVRSSFPGGLAALAWPLLSTLMSDVMATSDWLKLWDHCFTAGPDFLYYFLGAYLMALRAPLLEADTGARQTALLAGPTKDSIDVGKVLQKAYALRKATPVELRVVSPPGAGGIASRNGGGKGAASNDVLPPIPLHPISRGSGGGNYVEFQGIPAAAMELFSQDRQKMRDAEEAIMRRRKVVSELEVRTKVAVLQASSLVAERQQLAQLEERRRAQARQMEAQMMTQIARLDDRAKEERLRQIASVEEAYQASIAGVRNEWKIELNSLHADIAHKRATMGYAIKARQEEEELRVLEFQARQRLRELEQESTKAAIQARMRDETAAHQAAQEARQRMKLQAWEEEEEARRLQAEQQAARHAKLSAEAEAGAAAAAAGRLVQEEQRKLEDELLKAESSRRMRLLAEDEAALMAAALEAESQRQLARSAADARTLHAQAQADLEWYQAEAQQREMRLARHRAQQAAAEAAARQRRAEDEAAQALRDAQAALLKRRQELERLDEAEASQARSLLAVLAREEERNSRLDQELAAKAEEAQAALDAARRETSAREAANARRRWSPPHASSSPAGTAGGGLQPSARVLQAVQELEAAELAAMRRRHEDAMRQLELGKRAAGTDASWQRQQQAGQEADLSALQRRKVEFEERRRVFEDELHAKELAARVALQRLENAATIAPPSQPSTSPSRPSRHPPDTSGSPLVPISSLPPWAKRSATSEPAPLASSVGDENSDGDDGGAAEQARRPAASGRAGDESRSHALRGPSPAANDGPTGRTASDGTAGRTASIGTAGITASATVPASHLQAGQNAAERIRYSVSSLYPTRTQESPTVSHSATHNSEGSSVGFAARAGKRRAMDTPRTSSAASPFAALSYDDTPTSSAPDSARGRLTGRSLSSAADMATDAAEYRQVAAELALASVAAGRAQGDVAVTPAARRPPSGRKRPDEGPAAGVAGAGGSTRVPSTSAASVPQPQDAEAVQRPGHLSRASGGSSEVSDVRGTSVLPHVAQEAAGGPHAHAARGAQAVDRRGSAPTSLASRLDPGPLDQSAGRGVIAHTTTSSRRSHSASTTPPSDARSTGGGRTTTAARPTGSQDTPTAHSTAGASAAARSSSTGQLPGSYTARDSHSSGRLPGSYTARVSDRSTGGSGTTLSQMYGASVGATLSALTDPGTSSDPSISPSTIGTFHSSVGGGHSSGSSSTSVASTDPSTTVGSMVGLVSGGSLSAALGSAAAAGRRVSGDGDSGVSSGVRPVAAAAGSDGGGGHASGHSLPRLPAGTSSSRVAGAGRMSESTSVRRDDDVSASGGSSVNAPPRYHSAPLGSSSHSATEQGGQSGDESGSAAPSRVVDGRQFLTLSSILGGGGFEQDDTPSTSAEYSRSGDVTERDHLRSSTASHGYNDQADTLRNSTASRGYNDQRDRSQSSFASHGYDQREDDAHVSVEGRRLALSSAGTSRRAGSGPPDSIRPLSSTVTSGTRRSASARSYAEHHAGVSSDATSGGGDGSSGARTAGSRGGRFDIAGGSSGTASRRQTDELFRTLNASTSRLPGEMLMYSVASIVALEDERQTPPRSHSGDDGSGQPSGRPTAPTLSWSETPPPPRGGRGGSREIDGGSDTPSTSGDVSDLDGLIRHVERNLNLSHSTFASSEAGGESSQGRAWTRPLRDAGMWQDSTSVPSDSPTSLALSDSR